MKNAEIEVTLKRIMEIEDKANHIQDKIDRLKEVKEKELRKKQKDLDMAYIKAARKKGKKKKDHILMEAERESKELYETCEKERRKLNYILENQKKKIVDEVFAELFSCDE